MVASTIVASKQDSYRQVNLICRTTACIDGKRAQASQFCRKNKIRSRPEHEVSESSTVPSEDQAGIVLVSGETADVTSKGVVLRDNSVNLQLWRELEFQLSPSSRGIYSS